MLGIIGLGAIGSLVADTAIKLGMRVIGFDPEITVDAAWRLPSAVRRANSIDELLRVSDFVTLHVPLLPVTKHLIDARRLALAKPGSVLLNFARDAVVDEQAVLGALDEGRLAAYLCDFPSAALIGHPRVVALPHLGASTAEAEENCAIMVVDQVRDFLEDGTIRNAVNFPTVEMGRESPFRVAIANANVPNMLGQISSTMAKAGLNIHNMVNKSRGEMAYTLVDVDSPVEKPVIEAIAAIDGVLTCGRSPPNPSHARRSPGPLPSSGEAGPRGLPAGEARPDRGHLARAVDDVIGVVLRARRARVVGQDAQPRADREAARAPPCHRRAAKRCRAPGWRRSSTSRRAAGRRRRSTAP